MLASELDYELPEELIAQEPVHPRDSARLMRLERDSGKVEHFHIYDLPSLLRPDDLLVFNDTRVLRARLKGIKAASGGRVEAILLREVETNLWEVLLKPSARLRAGTDIEFSAPDGAIRVMAQPVRRTEIGWILRFDPSESVFQDIREVLPQLGEVPLPPYIHKSAPESEYQTIYAREKAAQPGVALDSAAAPTAGLHFTPELFKQLLQCGITTAYVTLGVGIGTFRPVQTEVLEEHVMHEEEFEVSEATAQVINAQKQRGGRVVAVGTTTTRVLESVADENGLVRAGIEGTSIFIQPGYRFRCVDALITNFHLPRSTLLAMISSFAENGFMPVENLTGLEKIRSAYRQAVEEKYRFFSFGDAMLIE